MPASEIQFYLKTTVWQSKRQAMLNITGGKCQKCMRPWRRVTHKHFRNVGYEGFDDLQVVCNRCAYT